MEQESYLQVAQDGGSLKGGVTALDRMDASGQCNL